MRLFDQLLPVIRLLFSEPNPASLKAALSMQGRAGEELRLPMTAASTECKLGSSAALDDLHRIPVYRAGAEAAAAAGQAPMAPITAVTPAAPGGPARPGYGTCTARCSAPGVCGGCRPHDSL
ncbi:MAG TPA: dihydrodipicolinate synthase family protein [Duganella sp.]